MTQNGNGLVYDPVELGDAPSFGRKKRRNLFRVDDEVFEAAPGLPTDQAMEFMALAEGWTVDDPAQAMGIVRELFSKVLLPESLERFTARLSSMERPIEILDLPDIITWLFERYGLRPTEGSPDSSTGSENPGAGTRPEAALPSTALISTASPSTSP